MEFKNLYYKDKLLVINPIGDCGIVTLWSPIKTVYKKLSSAGVELDPQTSRIAVLGTLYGNGLPELLRNLLYNPQIRYLIILGKDLFGSRHELINFFERGLQEVSYLGTTMFAIVATERKMDGEVTAEDFAQRLSLTDLSQYRGEDARNKIKDFFTHLPPAKPCQTKRIHRPIPKVQVEWYPSNPRGHTVIRKHPLSAWKELIFCLVRFGQCNKIKKGERFELQNVKVVVEEPIEESRQQLAKHGFSLAELHTYQASILDPTPSTEQPYTYGNRLRGYFLSDEKIVDTLDTTIKHFQADPETRCAYISIWDTKRDAMPGIKGHPCLVSLFFRKFSEKLTLTATFRTHNALDGWLMNLYGLMAIQKHVAKRLSIPVGSISVISHSISIDPQGNGMERARAIAKDKKSDDLVDKATGRRSTRLDANGEFVVTTDLKSKEIVVHHIYKGQTLKEYRAKKCETLEKMLARDLAISDISHALYLGREMARQDYMLNNLT